MRAPVAFLIFNRPDVTAQVFREIALARPPRLFLIADGPRPGHPGDEEKCAAARAVVERVDWPCRVDRNYSDVNLGCGVRPATGISWVFEQVEEAILLEDDCLPHPTFFRYCDELLEHYRDDERIMNIAGTDWQFGRRRSRYSYWFSMFNISWGWASWRRAWRHYDRSLRMWPELRETNWLRDKVGDPAAAGMFQDAFDRAHAAGGNLDYWDYQWTFTCWAQSGLSILPSANLVSNIGFGPDATHTFAATGVRARAQRAAMQFPLEHPPIMVRDHEADRFIVEHVIWPQLGVSQGRRGARRLAALVPTPFRRWARRLLDRWSRSVSAQELSRGAGRIAASPGSAASRGSSELQARSQGHAGPPHRSHEGTGVEIR
jgi:hypothetical protein